MILNKGMMLLIQLVSHTASTKSIKATKRNIIAADAVIKINADPMKNPIYLLALFVLLAASTQPILAQENSTNATGTNFGDLIDAKNKELQKLKEEMQAVKKNLDETVTARKGLQSELKTIDKNITAMELAIRAGELENQKLELEMQSLSTEIDGINKALDSGLKTIPELLREYHEKSEVNLFVLLLQKKTLADSFAEMQSLSSIQAQLAAQLDENRKLKEDLKDKQDEVLSKQQEIEVEKRGISARQTIAQGEKERKQTLLAETKNKESLYQKNFDELAKKAMAFEAEIERIESALRKNIDLSKLPAPRPGLLANPVPGARLTQGYGRTQFAVRNYRSQWHNGIDLGAPVGTPVYATEAGEVVAMGNTDKYCPRGAYGKYVVIKHGNGLTTFYSHFSASVVSVGQKVSRGEPIGYVGNTGWSTGPHTQVTVYASNTYAITQSKSCGPLPVGGDINPLDYISL